MAKGQKRSNREIRKPKAEKPPVVATPMPLNKGALGATKGSQKKG